MLSRIQINRLEKTGLSPPWTDDMKTLHQSPSLPPDGQSERHAGSNNRSPPPITITDLFLLTFLPWFFISFAWKYTVYKNNFHSVFECTSYINHELSSIKCYLLCQQVTAIFKEKKNSKIKEHEYDWLQPVIDIGPLVTFTCITMEATIYVSLLMFTINRLLFDTVS